MTDLAKLTFSKLLGIAKMLVKRVGRPGEKHSGAENNYWVGVAINRAKYVVIDTELTGLDLRKDSIISIGAVRMHGGRIDMGDTFYKLISPESCLTGESVIIHGIRPADLEEEPKIGAVLPGFIEFCGDDIVVGFMPLLDLGFLDRELKKVNGLSIKNPVVDVFEAYRWAMRKNGNEWIGNPTLYEMAKALDVPVKGAHNAIYDAFITAQVFQRLLHILSTLGVKDVSELLDVSNPFKGGDKFSTSSAAFNNF